jgi:hypothetical protein
MCDSLATATEAGICSWNIDSMLVFDAQYQSGTIELLFLVTFPISGHFERNFSYKYLVQTGLSGSIEKLHKC